MTSSEPELLSPSRAWRLTECPASGQPSGPRPHFRVPARNAGALAHDAVERWIEDKGYRSDDARAWLSRSLDAALAAAGGAPPPRWTIIRSRLRARASELVAAIGSGSDSGSVVVPETRLTDPTLAIEGTPDIVVVGKSTALIDLKTEDLDSNVLSPWVLFQLRIYAHLVRQAYGTLPNRVEVFSANRGRIPVPVSTGDVQAALAALESVRQEDNSLARPAPDTCHFCKRRLVCSPHWDAVATWPEPDCIEGRLEDTEHAANGLVAARLKTANDSVLVSGIPVARLTAPAGSCLRFVRVNQKQMDGAAGANWRWGALSDVGLI